MKAYHCCVGSYPTVAPFAFLEETSFTNNGKPFLAYSQKTSSPCGTPMHTETGYLRVFSGEVEWLLCDPTGLCTILKGTIVDDPEQLILEFSSTHIKGTPSAKEVKESFRRLIVTKGVCRSLEYTVTMAAVGQAMTQHLQAKLFITAAGAVSKEDFAKLNGSGFLLVDVREEEEFEAGHLEGSISCPLGQLVSQSKKSGTIAFEMTSNKEQKIVLYCASGLRAQMAATEIRGRGGNDHIMALTCSWVEVVPTK